MLGHDIRSAVGWLLIFTGICLAAVDLWRDVAFVVTPFALALALITLDYAAAGARWSATSLALRFTFGAVPISYALALAVGLPCLILLQRIGVRRLWHYAVTGASVGLGIALVFIVAVTRRATHVIAHGGEPTFYRWQICLVFSVLAAMSCFVCYWFFSVRAQPNGTPTI